MRRGRLPLLLALSAVLACRRDGGRRGGQLPPGDAVWFAAGLSSAEGDAEQVLSRGGFARVFLPAARVEGQRVIELPPPARPFARVPVILVVHGGEDAEQDLAGGAEALAASIRAALERLLRRQSAWGRVEGVHLDFLFTPATAEAYGRLARALRPAIAPGLTLTASLRFAPVEKDRGSLAGLLSAVDGLVAFVFGEGSGADPISTDALGKPWWSGYIPAARGIWRDASGSLRGTLGEKSLRLLTDDPRAPFTHDLSFGQENVSGFVFEPTEPIQADGRRFRPGDQIVFRQWAISQLLYRMGSDLSGRRFVRGRVVVLDGASDAERIFTLAALSDVLLGRPLLPDLRVAVAAEHSRIRVSAENRSPHASEISRTANWVEVDVPAGGIRDVRPGGFDRFEVFDPQGRAVSLGRATRVRFYETLLAPLERLEEATILLRHSPARDCCRFREHVLAASGTEIGGDWINPPAAGSPTTR